ncbi:MAG: 30S ribosomal protein S17 [Deltaproteobacteria bacterium]|nr:30S ribosomal protein S17 [Deltaproteobacteria bacterium]
MSESDTTLEAPSAETPKGESAKPEAPSRGRKRHLVGKVISAKMQKTVVVEVSRRVLDPVFKKFVRHRARYKAHDEKSACRAGDQVEIREHRPLSREKRWVVARVIARQEEGI